MVITVLMASFLSVAAQGLPTGMPVPGSDGPVVVEPQSLRISAGETELTLSLLDHAELSSSVIRRSTCANASCGYGFVEAHDPASGQTHLVSFDFSARRLSSLAFESWDADRDSLAFVLPGMVFVASHAPLHLPLATGCTPDTCAPDIAQLAYLLLEEGEWRLKNTARRIDEGERFRVDLKRDSPTAPYYGPAVLTYQSETGLIATLAGDGQWGLTSPQPITPGAYLTVTDEELLIRRETGEIMLFPIRCTYESCEAGEGQPLPLQTDDPHADFHVTSSSIWRVEHGPQGASLSCLDRISGQIYHEHAGLRLQGVGLATMPASPEPVLLGTRSPQAGTLLLRAPDCGPQLAQTPDWLNLAEPLRQLRPAFDAVGEVLVVTLPHRPAPILEVSPLHPNPVHGVMIQAYAGYGLTDYPVDLDAVQRAWLEAGGVLAYVFARGSGVLGPDWANEGALDRRLTIADVQGALNYYRQASDGPVVLRGHSFGAALMLAVGLDDESEQTPDVILAENIAIRDDYDSLQTYLGAYLGTEVQLRADPQVCLVAFSTPDDVVVAPQSASRLEALAAPILPCRQALSAEQGGHDLLTQTYPISQEAAGRVVRALLEVLNGAQP